MSIFWHDWLGCMVTSQCGFNLHFARWDVENLLPLYLLVIDTYLGGDVYLNLLSIFIRFPVSLLLICKSIIHILDMHIFSHYFLTSVLLKLSCREKKLNLDKVQFNFFFLLWLMYFVSCQRIICLHQVHKDVSFLKYYISYI